MKKQRIDFFSSPNPTSRHFNLTNLFQQKFHQFPQALPQDMSFNTPARHTQNNPRTPNINIDPYFSTTRKTKTKQPMMDEQFDEESQEESMEFEEDVERYDAIGQRIQFSQEEHEGLMAEITPKKIFGFEKDPQDDENEMTTKKKAIMMSTPMSQGRIHEKGLKKLAKDAFTFVCSQKRTTYKQVARKLIYNLSDQKEQEYHKRGQMNIKRRVYDALNVLIALGLLKRNGNKIMCKKIQSEIKGKQRLVNTQKRQQFLQNQFQYYKKQTQKKQGSMNQKRNIINKIQRQVQRIKVLQARNSKQKLLNSSSQIIKFPLLMMFREQGKKPKNQKHQSQESLFIYQDTQQNLKCSFNNNKNKISIISDVDMLEYISTPPSYSSITFEKPVELQKGQEKIVQRTTKIRKGRRW